MKTSAACGIIYRQRLCDFWNGKSFKEKLGEIMKSKLKLLKYISKVTFFDVCLGSAFLALP